jgi:hypothetical protein
MKFIAALLALSLSATSFAGVKEDVVALSKLSFGYNAQAVKGKTAEAIFKRWLEVTNGETDGMVYKEIKDMDYGDEVSEGFTSTKSAIAMGEFAMSHLQEAMENASGAELSKLKKELAALQKGWKSQIEKLAAQGVKFGYTGWGPGYCGVSFIELIVVDPKGQQIYEVYLSRGGQC